MKLIRIFFAVTLIFFLTSSAKKASTFLVTVKKRFTIELVDYFSQMEDLSEGALLQYGYADYDRGELKECYLIVYYEAQKSLNKLKMKFNLESYMDIWIDNIEYGLIDAKIDKNQNESQIVNGLEFMSCDIEGEFGDIDIYYQLGIYHGEKGYYTLLAWTPLELKDEFESDLSEMIRTFKEL